MGYREELLKDADTYLAEAKKAVNTDTGERQSSALLAIACMLRVQYISDDSVV